MRKSMTVVVTKPDGTRTTKVVLSGDALRLTYDLDLEFNGIRVKGPITFTVDFK